MIKRFGLFETRKRWFRSQTRMIAIAYSYEELERLSKDVFVNANSTYTIRELSSTEAKALTLQMLG